MSRWLMTSFAVILIAIALVAYEFWRSQPSQHQVGVTPNTATPLTPEGQSTLLPGNEAIQTVTNSGDSMEPEAIGSVELWQVLHEHPKDVPTIRRDVPQKQLVKLEATAFTSLRQGLKVPLTIPGVDQPLVVTVTNVETLESGNVSISGKVNDNHWLDFVATIGKDAIYATIGTEAGVYNLRGNKELAWIVPGRAFNHHVDPNVLDYVIPEKMELLPLGVGSTSHD